MLARLRGLARVIVVGMALATGARALGASMAYSPQLAYVDSAYRGSLDSKIILFDAARHLAYVHPVFAEYVYQVQWINHHQLLLGSTNDSYVSDFHAFIYTPGQAARALPTVSGRCVLGAAGAFGIACYTDAPKIISLYRYECLTNICSEESMQLEMFEDILAFAFTPDGQHIVTVGTLNRTHLMIWDVFTGALAYEGYFADTDRSPILISNQHIALIEDLEIADSSTWVVTVVNWQDASRKQFRLDEIFGPLDRHIARVTWRSQDETLGLFASRAATSDPSAVALINIQTGEQQVLRGLHDVDFWSMSQPSWSPDGGYLAFSDRYWGYYVNIDDGALSPTMNINDPNDLQFVSNMVWRPCPEQGC